MSPLHIFKDDNTPSCEGEFHLSRDSENGISSQQWCSSCVLITSCGDADSAVLVHTETHTHEGRHAASGGKQSAHDVGNGYSGPFQKQSRNRTNSRVLRRMMKCGPHCSFRGQHTLRGTR